MSSTLGPQFRKVLYNNIEGKLYNHGQHLIDKARQKIARQNGNRSFYYAGIAYNIFGVKTTPLQYAIKLPLEFTPFMDETLKEEQALEKEKHIVLTYIRRGLNIGNTIQDFKELFPEVLQNYFPQFSIAIIKTWEQDKITLSSEELLSFQQSNQDISNIIKERLITNLLLQDL